MSAAKSPQAGLTRRSFLKTTAAVAGAAALTGSAGAMTALAAEETEGQAGERIFHAVCAVNCNTQGCGLRVHVREGKAYKVTAKTDVEIPEGVEGYCYDRRPCLRGRSHVQWIYDPERIQYPLRRVDGTERGAGQWERITWDDAIAEIVTKFKGYIDEYGSRSIAVTRMWGNAGVVHGLYGAVPRFAHAMQATWLDDCLDIGAPTGNLRVVGEQYGGNNSFWDVQNARTLVIWGANLTEVNAQSWYWATVAQEKGTKIVCIDPRYSITASKADVWVPIKQGTDSVLILGTIRHIIENGQSADDYLMKYSVAPYLVRADNGLFLRTSDVAASSEDSTDATAESNPVLVWDEAAGKAVPDGEALAPAMTGSYEVGGVRVSTAFELLKEQVSPYTLEKTSEITGVDEQTIRDLASYYVNGPCATWITYGLDRYDNSHVVGHGWATLVALTGNYGIQGGGCGLPASAKGGIMLLDVGWMVPGGGRYSNTVPWLCLADVVKSGQFKGNPYPIKAILNVAGNPFSNHTQQKEFFEEVLPKIEFVVSHDLRMTDTCRYSDIVLPATHIFEHDDLNGSGAWLQINEKAVEPMGEAKSNLELFNLLAEPLGIGEFFGRTASEVVEGAINGSAALASLGITYERLKKEKVVCHLKPAYYDGVGIRDFTFKTPSKKLEFYQEKPVPRLDYGQTVDLSKYRLPFESYPDEAWEGSPLHDKYPLVAYQEHSRWRVHGTFGNLPWLRELDPEPTVKLNPKDAERRGIVNGDLVVAFNDRGSVKLKAVIDAGLPEGMCNIPKGWQRDQFIEGGYQELTSRRLNPVTVNQSYSDVLVDVQKAK